MRDHLYSQTNFSLAKTCVAGFTACTMHYVACTNQWCSNCMHNNYAKKCSVRLMIEREGKGPL